MKTPNRRPRTIAADYRVLPPDYAPGTQVALARGRGDQALQPVYGDPSIVSEDIKSDLFAPMGGTGTLILQGIIQQDEYNAKLEGENLLRVTDQMWRSDGQAAALLNVVTLPLTSAEKTIEPASESAEDRTIAQFVSDNLFGGMDHPFSESDEYVTRVYLRDGFAVLEKVYVKSDDGKIRIRKLAQRINKTIYRWYPDDDDNLDRIQQRVWTVDPNGMTGTYRYPVIPAHKLCVFTNTREGNNFQGLSIYRPAYKHWYIKAQLETIQAIQAERLAVAVPHFSEPMGPVQKSDRDRAAAVGAALHAHQSAYVITPNGWNFDFKSPGSVIDLTPSIEYHSLQMVRAVLAQFLNLDRGGSYALSMDISTFFMQSEQGRARYLSDQWSAQVIKPLVDMNFPGVTRYPKLVYSELDKRDVDKFLAGLAAVLPFITMNADTENWLRTLLDAPDLPPEATLAGGGSLTVQTSGQGKSADPAARAEEVGAAKTQGQQDRNQPAAADADAGSTVALSRLPDWARETALSLLADPPEGLSARAWRDVVWAEARAATSVAA